MIGYARSITDQGLSRQREKLLAAGCEVVFEDRQGGNTVVRPQLETALATMAGGDALCVCRLDRLVWDVRDLLAFTLALSERGIHLVALDQDIDTRRDNGAFFCFAAMLTEHHRGARADRVAEHRARRKQPGRPRKAAETSWEALASEIASGAKTVDQVAAELEVSRATVYRRLPKAARSA